jgi:Dyp-type peroxidase family
MSLPGAVSQRLRRRRRDWRTELPPKAQTRVNHVDQRDLQGNVLCGYGDDFARGVHLFVSLHRGKAEQVRARRLLRELAEQVTNAVPWADGHKPSWTLNVALSHAGLKKLGLPAPVLDSFPPEFEQGMSKRRGALGDGPEKWQDELETEADVLLTVMARTRGELGRREAELKRRLEDSECVADSIHREPVGLLVHPLRDIVYAREHFGFTDGFSQPAIRGNAGPTQRDGMGTPWILGRWRNVRPGEFVLGYRGEDGVLPKAPAEPFGRSGSFLVLRKMQQHVARFHDYLRDKAEAEVDEAGGGEDGRADAVRREALSLGARIVGRWQDGRSLVVSQNPNSATVDHRETAFLQNINKFRYSQDSDGYRCPLGSHVRRANPRDDLGRAFKWHGKLTKRHRIIRRGMPYPDLSEDAQADESSGDERGLMFVCYQASIERQFELIQGKWLNDGDAFWLGAEKDFLTIPAPAAEQTLADGGPPSNGADPLGHDRMTIQDPERPRFLAPHPSFVQIRGGGYYLTPGLSALRELGSAYWL